MKFKSVWNKEETQRIHRNSLAAWIKNKDQCRLENELARKRAKKKHMERLNRENSLVK